MKLPLILSLSLVLIPASSLAATKYILFGGATRYACTPPGAKFYAGGSGVSEVIQQITKNPNDRFVIAGHSNGATPAYAVANKLSPKDRERITVANLDGWNPSGRLAKGVKVKCYTATNGRGAFSRGHKYLGHCSAGPVTASGCNDSWCLHMALVQRMNGKSCSPFTGWMK